MTIMESRPLGQSGISLGTLGFGGGPVGWRSTPEVESEVDALLDAVISYLPAATATTPVKPVTGTGLLRQVFVLSPSWPALL